MCPCVAVKRQDNVETEVDVPVYVCLTSATHSRAKRVSNARARALADGGET